MGITQAQAHRLPQDLGHGPACSDSPLRFGGTFTACTGAMWSLGLESTPSLTPPGIPLPAPLPVTHTVSFWRERLAPPLPPALDPGRTVPHGRPDVPSRSSAGLTFTDQGLEGSMVP